ncbi:S-adenosylmethionine synthase isoform X2 [Ixodes scapularis]
MGTLQESMDNSLSAVRRVDGQQEMPGEEESFLFTSESVGEGHPDKMCDLISDAVLDAYLAKDPEAKVACESVAKTGMILLAGEITSVHTIDYQRVVRDTIKEIGYDDSSKGFDYKTCNVVITIEQQAQEIARGVHHNRLEDDLVQLPASLNVDDEVREPEHEDVASTVPSTSVTSSERVRLDTVMLSASEIDEKEKKAEEKLEQLLSTSATTRKAALMAGVSGADQEAPESTEFHRRELASSTREV